MENEKKYDELVQFYIGDLVKKVGFIAQNDKGEKQYIHNWGWTRTVDSVRQYITIKEQPMNRGNMVVSVGGGKSYVRNDMSYDGTMDGFEGALKEIGDFLASSGYEHLNQMISNKDRMSQENYLDLYSNYKRYAEKFMAENNLSEESSVSDRLMMIERVIERCHERGKSFVNNKKDLMQAAGCLATIISDIPGAEWKISEDKADCYFTREPAGHYRLIFSVTGTILFYLENGLDGDSLVELMEDIYTDEEYDEFIENIQRK